ncbi:MAG: sugar phosphate isomerase/epimerase family protein, partial [Isosphaeraceae bacterium]
MRIGYNTNGLAHHRLTDAITLLADEGYQSVAITLDAGALDPYEEPAAFRKQLQNVREILEKRQLGCVIETGARFLLNPRKKHDPTLLDPSPERRDLRTDFLIRAIDIAAELNADAVSFWSGALSEDTSETAALERLTAALRPIIGHAEAR